MSRNSLNKLLPAPVQAIWDREDEERAAKLQERPVSALVKASLGAPPYGERKGWVPKCEDDYGDGGAFPEIHVAQYPLSMGGKKESSSNALAVQLDSEGKVKYDLIARQGHSKDKIIYSKLNDLLPVEILQENDQRLQKPGLEVAEETTNRTKAALEKIIQSKIAAALPVRRAEQRGPAQFIRYTPSQQNDSFNSGAKQRVIRMVEAQVDPLEPPKFQTNKKVPRGPPSPPAPVMHSPPRKATVKDQRDWKIPPCISNWKNSKGYTVPLDKRLAADGRGLQQNHINENFAKLAEALYIADRKARESVEMRAQLEKKLAQKEKEKKEDHLRQLAEQARMERAGIKAAAYNSDDKEGERDKLRQERHKERARDRNLARAGPGSQSRLHRERDISEQVALGMPVKTAAVGDQMYDQRLYTSQGMDSGFAHDDDYNVYDKPWRDSSSLANAIYRPKKDLDSDIYGGDLESLKNTNRFVPDKGFSGTDRTGPGRSGPVQFEKEEEDPFGLDQFLKQAKGASGNTSSTSKRKDDDKRSEKSDKKRKY